MAKVKLPVYQRTQLVAGPYGTGDDSFDSVVLLVPFDDNIGTQQITNIAQTSDGRGSFVNTAAFDRAVTRFPAGPRGPTSDCARW